ncbi:MAG TPA: hypothetical protein VF444_08725 [Pseudonocardiaceae bacterium]
MKILDDNGGEPDDVEEIVDIDGGEVVTDAAVEVELVSGLRRSRWRP